MKIGLVCPYDIFRSGGVQEVVLALQRELKKMGHEAKIITPLLKANNGNRLPGTIFIGTAAKVRSPFHTSAEVSVSLNVEEIDSMLAREKFDVLHFHEPWVPIMSRQLLSRSTAVNVATFHAKLPESMMSRTIERVITPYTRSVLKHLTSLSAVSEAAADFIHSLTDETIVIIPNGVDLEKYHQVNQSTKLSQQILYIGRLEKRKGVKYLLRAFAQLAKERPEAELVIAGAGPEQQRLVLLAEELEVSHVKFLGYVTERQKLKLLAQAALFCSPAIYGESFGIVLLEAMASGAVVVAGDNPGYSAVLKDRGQLSLVNPKDTYEFARRLQLMLEDKDLIRVWQKWAADYVKQFAYPVVAKQYEQLYLQAMADKQS